MVGPAISRSPIHTIPSPSPAAAALPLFATALVRGSARVAQEAEGRSRV